MRLHPASLLVGAGLLASVIALSSAAPQNTLTGTPQVTVNNPLGVPGWIPKDVWMARYGWNAQTGQHDYQDYTVPAGHFALVRSITGNAVHPAGPYPPHIDVDEGNGFYQLTSMGSGANETGVGGGNLDPGIVIDEGAVIRANASGPVVVTVHGYLIEKD